MAGDLLEQKKLTISLRNIVDIVFCFSIAFLGYKVTALNTEVKSIISLMEATSEEATRKIQMMQRNYSIADPVYDGRLENFENTDFNVGKVGALRVTKRLENAFGGNVKIVVKPDEAERFYIAEVGNETFKVTPDGDYLIVDGVKVPLNEDEYAKFRESGQFQQASGMPEDTNPSSTTRERDSTSPQSTSTRKTESVPDKLTQIYGEEVPGLKIAHDNYKQRLVAFEKAKEHAITFSGIDAKKDLYVFFDISCPSCRKFFKSIPLYQEEGYNIHLMLIDKTRGYSSNKAKQMMSIYCEADPKAALVTAIEGMYKGSEDCGYGKQYLESMTNAALLVGTIGTPSIFTPDAIPIYRYSENKGRYSPMYNFSNVTDWLTEHGY